MTTLAELYSALKYCVKVDRYGTRRYYNGAGQLHRLEGPAVVWPNGNCEWYQNGRLHRTNGPAVVWKGGHTDWWLNGVPYTEQAYYAQLKTLEQTS